MATAKIATLLIRTLAKPIATQLKTQAASHESFRRVCVGIAQTMHKTEMALRYNLLPKAPPLPRSSSSSSTEEGKEENTHTRPKVRPLNEAKAIANGANFLSEAFLFSIAATLVILETWRSSNKTKRSRAKTADGLERMETAVRKLCALHGVDPRSVGLDDDDDEDADDDSTAESEESELDDEAKQEASRHAAAMQHRLNQENEVKKLQKAVDVLLRMAIKNGTIMGGEALDLQAVLDGKERKPDEESSTAAPAAAQQANITSTPILTRIAQQQIAQQNPPQSTIAQHNPHQSTTT